MYFSLPALMASKENRRGHLLAKKLHSLSLEYNPLSLSPVILNCASRVHVLRYFFKKREKSKRKLHLGVARGPTWHFQCLLARRDDGT